MRDKILLRQLQALPLNAKVLMTQQRIREWYNYFNGNVCISFSGGKDSTVLTYLVHDMYPNVPLVFANTGLEYPEIQAFAREMGAEFVRPKMRFDEVISKYGYPIIGKEVAEAISFARRIVKNDIGGVQHNKKATSRESNCEDYGRQEADGTGRTKEQRTSTPPPTWKNWLEKSKPHRQHSASQGKTEQNYKADGTIYGSMEPSISVPPPSREIRRINRFRRQLLGK